MCFMVGLDSGASLLGLLFHSIGKQNTLLAIAVSTLIMSIIFLLYVKYCSESEDSEKYEKIAADEEDDDNKLELETIVENDE